MLTADKARRAACAANDDFIDLRERVSAGITRACEAGRFEARIALHRDDTTELVRALCAHLADAGYRSFQLEIDGREILVVSYGAKDEPRKDDDEAKGEDTRGVVAVPERSASQEVHDP